MSSATKTKYLLDYKYIYKDETGFIKGYWRKEEKLYWIAEFLIYPEYRGKGLAKKLAEHLPKKCKLFAMPMIGSGLKFLKMDLLIKFYESIGFKKIHKDDTNLGWIMERK